MAWLVKCLVGLFLGASFGEICAKTMYAQNDTRTPTLIGGICVLIGAVFKLTFAVRFGLTSLVVITSLIFMTSCLAQLFVLVSRYGWGIFNGIANSFFSTLFAAILAAFAGYGILMTQIPLASIVGLLFGAIVYFTGLLIFDSTIRSDVYEQLRGKTIHP